MTFPAPLNPAPPGHPPPTCLPACLPGAGLWASLQFRFVQLQYPGVVIAFEKMLVAGCLPVAAAVQTWGLVSGVGMGTATFFLAGLLCVLYYFFALPMPSSFHLGTGRRRTSVGEWVGETAGVGREGEGRQAGRQARGRWGGRHAGTQGSYWEAGRQGHDWEPASWVSSCRLPLSIATASLLRSAQPHTTPDTCAS